MVLCFVELQHLLFHLQELLHFPQPLVVVVFLRVFQLALRQASSVIGKSTVKEVFPSIG